MISRLEVLDKGFVELYSVMGDDSTVCESARVSFANENKVTTPQEDKNLIDYLIRNHHNTPLEMVEFRFKIKMPIFLARQHMRHRMSSINEYSGRYTELEPDFFVPDEFYKQSTSNKQGRSGEAIDNSQNMVDTYSKDMEESHYLYKSAVDGGVAKEMARINLPLSTYTVFFWKIDLHNLLHYLDLRLHYHAQKEIQDYAHAILELIRSFVPMSIESWENQVLNSVSFSGRETKALEKFFNGAGDYSSIFKSTILNSLPDERERRILKEKMENFKKHYIDIGETNV